LFLDFGCYFQRVPSLRCGLTYIIYDRHDGLNRLIPRHIPTSTDQQGGVSFQITPMGKITHTHSPRTRVESSTTYLRVQICAYSPRTGIRSKCLQNPWELTLTMEPNHLRRLHDAVGFFFFPTTNRQIPTGTNSGFFLFYHDQPTKTYGYYIHGFNFSPTKT